MFINNIGTHIKVRNFAKSLKFYKSLGFVKVFEYGPKSKVKEDYSGAVFAHGECKLEIADGHRAVKPAVFAKRMDSSKVSLMVNVKRLSTVLALCKKNRIAIAVAPRHFYWGTLELVVKDPDGVVLVFIAPYTKSEAKRIAADERWATKPN